MLTLFAYKDVKIGIKIKNLYEPLCPLVVIGDSGACAWLFIESRAMRANQAHAPKTKPNATKKNSALAMQVGLRFSSLLSFTHPFFVIPNKRSFVYSMRVHTGAFFIYFAQYNAPQLSIFSTQRIYHCRPEQPTKIRVFDYPYAEIPS